MICIRIKRLYISLLQFSLLFICSMALSACGFLQPELEETPPAAKKVVSTAYSQIGKKYQPGGASPKKGFDCSGLIYWVYKENGYKVPRMTIDQARIGCRVSQEDAREGDILVFKTSQSPRGLHTGIYTGKHSFIHSPSTGKQVKEDTVDKPYWKQRLVSVRRVIQ